MKPAPNVGKTDKLIRVVIGGFLVGAATYYEAWWLLGIGMLIVLTAAIGRCGLYYILGINTCSMDSSQ
ncbi:MAG: DUF2892 domain-containing protein [Bacteroidia bacterium]|nr:DUF2892 domain-containing protein [Bacteroidia bacterium]MDW8235322.1 DUF2892 domain-containing protein [Bacteroidia bacterium]